MSIFSNPLVVLHFIAYGCMFVMRGGGEVPREAHRKNCDPARQRAAEKLSKLLETPEAGLATTKPETAGVKEKNNPDWAISSEISRSLCAGDVQRL